MSGVAALTWVVIRNTDGVDCQNNLGLYSGILTQDVNPAYVCWQLKYPTCWLWYLSSVQGIYILPVSCIRSLLLHSRHTLHQVNTQFWILILNGIKKWRDFDPRILHHHRQITWVTFNEPPQLPRHETGILWPQKVVITHLGKSVSTAQCQFC